MSAIRLFTHRFSLFRVSCQLALFLAVGFAPAALLAEPLSRQVAGEIGGILERDGAPRLLLGRELLLNGDLLPGFYRTREHLPAWVDDLGLNHSGRQLLDLLRGADQEGLCPEDYHLTQIEPLLELEADCRRYGILFDSAYMARLDLLLTDAFFLYATHLIEGRVDPSEVHQGWRARPRQVDLVRLLQNALASGRLLSVLADIVPPHRGYLLLRAELERYRRISAVGGWPVVPDGALLRPGNSDPRLPLLRERLRVSGDLQAEVMPEGELFDQETVAALIHFQRRHGLDGDGVLGPKTLEELNLPVEVRLRQIELNLERWRWLPKDLGERYILVNIADFRLSVIAGERNVLTMPVVVGTAYRKTPVFSASMHYLIFAPYWNVPPTILREDKLPKIKIDPGFVERQHFEIVRGSGEDVTRINPREIRWSRVSANTFPGQLRQKPGPWNPLGRVKFIFPNDFDVYLHDTPDKQLFGRDARTFSSGCIRIQRPLDLAQYLLEGQGWDCDRILAAMGRRTPLRVDLARSLPVHVLYWTAWVDAEGSLQFRDDIYLRDLDLDLALSHRRAEADRQPQSGLPHHLFKGG